MLSIENLKVVKYHTFWKKIISFFFIIFSKCKNKDKIIFKVDKSIEILKTLGSIENK